MKILKLLPIKIVSRKLLLLAIVVVICPKFILAQKTVRYDLYMYDTIVNFAGKKKSDCCKLSNTQAHTHIYSDKNHIYQ